jgi:hypothetical protein
VLIVDEAHRLNEKSGLYANLGENQVKEPIASAKCTIFFIDDDQRVTLKDIGSTAAIKQFADGRGAHVEEHVLASQFRCGGSDAYLAWLDNTLAIRPTANMRLSPREFDFRVFDTPHELHTLIESRNGNNKARMVAGYCLDWKSKTRPSAYDITIGDTYRKRWNLGTDGSLWIIAEDSVSAVGSIHTCQGLELEYVGVIIGPTRRLRPISERRSRQPGVLSPDRLVRRIAPARFGATALRLPTTPAASPRVRRPTTGRARAATTTARSNRAATETRP